MLLYKKMTLAAAALLLFVGCKKKTDVVPELSSYKIKKIIISGDDPQEYYFSYNQENVLVKTTGKGSGDWDLTQQVESDYTFDANGNLTMVSSALTGFGSGVETIAVQYEYDSQNRLVLQKASYYGNPFYESRRFYYSNGNEWKAEVEVSYDENTQAYETYDSTVYYSYNSFGKPASSKNYYSFSPLKYNEYEYSYDTYGNLISIKRRQTSDGGDWFTETRTVDHNSVVSFPREWYYFYMGMIDIAGLLDPDNGTEDFMNLQYSSEVECSNTTVTLTGNNSVEKNTNGTISRLVRNIGYMDYNTCTPYNRTYDHMFYY